MHCICMHWNRKSGGCGSDVTDRRGGGGEGGLQHKSYWIINYIRHLLLSLLFFKITIVFLFCANNAMICVCLFVCLQTIGPHVGTGLTARLVMSAQRDDCFVRVTAKG